MAALRRAWFAVLVTCAMLISDGPTSWHAWVSGVLVGLASWVVVP